MQPVLINGFLYFVDGNKVYEETKQSYTTMNFLTSNERQQIWRYTNNELYQDYLKEWLKRFDILIPGY